jgi:SRSO17 transposase
LVRDYVTEHLADENAVLVIDETGFLKQGGIVRGSAAIYWFGRQLARNG